MLTSFKFQIRARAIHMLLARKECLKSVQLKEQTNIARQLMQLGVTFPWNAALKIVPKEQKKN